MQFIFIIGHPNVKVFVTQCGAQSLEESIYANVPLVAMPFFADQDYNAKTVVSRGFGVYVDRKKLDKDGFKNAILEVINNPM